MARLTKSIKEKVLHNALNKAGVFERQLEVLKSRAALAEAVRVFAIGGADAEKAAIKAEKKIKALIGDIPKCINTAGYFRLDENSIISCAFGGMSTQLGYNGEVGRCGTTLRKAPSPCPYHHQIKFGVDHEFTSEFQRIETEQKTVKDIKEGITVNVNAMLNSVTTDKKLFEIWPESIELMPKEEAKQSVSLPTTDVKSLNDLIGIPSKGA